MYFVIDKSNNGQFYFKIKSDGNHETLCHSETYVSRYSAEHAIEIIKKEASTAHTLDMTKD